MSLDHNWYLREKLAEQHLEEAHAEAAKWRLLKELHQRSSRASLLARLRNLLLAYRARAAASRAQ